MKVLSQTEMMLRASWRSRRPRARSTSLSIGLVGVSTQTSFVFGVIAASRFSGLDEVDEARSRGPGA